MEDKTVSTYVATSYETSIYVMQITQHFDALWNLNVMYSSALALYSYIEHHYC